MSNSLVERASIDEKARTVKRTKRNSFFTMTIFDRCVIRIQIKIRAVCDPIVNQHIDAVGIDRIGWIGKTLVSDVGKLTWMPRNGLKAPMPIFIQ